jgi:ribosomal-protein-alanine N-acetyltransferase
MARWQAASGIMVQDDVHKHTAEIGYWLAEPHWGKGIMSKVVTDMTAWYFANFDLMRIYALAFDYNPASARVLQKAGYELEEYSAR